MKPCFHSHSDSFTTSLTDPFIRILGLLFFFLYGTRSVSRNRIYTPVLLLNVNKTSTTLNAKQNQIRQNYRNKHAETNWLEDLTHQSTPKHPFPELGGVGSPTCSTVCECVLCVCESTAARSRVNQHTQTIKHGYRCRNRNRFSAVMSKDRNMFLMSLISLSLSLAVVPGNQREASVAGRWKIPRKLCSNT